MTEPTTTLDPRFSDPASSATPWTDTQRALDDAELFWITTVHADGRPHVSPLVAVWLDDAIYFATGEAEQKAVNLRANPHVVLTTGCNVWDSGLGVVVEGPAVQVTDDALLARLAEAWSTKWDGRCVMRPGTVGSTIQAAGRLSSMASAPGRSWPSARDRSRTRLIASRRPHQLGRARHAPGGRPRR